jgi:hypothetical protein
MNTETLKVSRELDDLILEYIVKKITTFKIYAIKPIRKSLYFVLGVF